MSVAAASNATLAVVHVAHQAISFKRASDLPLGSIWWVPVVSAVIGATSALAATLVKDYILPILSERRLERASQKAVFRIYISPLVETCERLVWRFNEIFVASRHQFLKTATLPLVFNEYKRRSTLYRVASLIGWMRAIGLELSSLPRGSTGLLTPISRDLNEIRSAMADGPFVEMHRLGQLCAVWHIDLATLNAEQQQSLAARLEIELYRRAGDDLKHDSEFLSSLSEQRKREVCFGMADYLCTTLKRAPLNHSVVSETLEQAVQAMSYREALIYRDWQDAIGDAMLEADPDSVRRYRVKGYAAFEHLLFEAPIWFEVFGHSIDDIDFDAVNPNDFRAKQLRDLATSVAQLLLHLAEGPGKDLVSDDTRKAALNLVPEKNGVTQ